MSESLARMLKTHLNNPKDLQVTWWQHDDKNYSTGQTGVKYLVLFRVNDHDDNGRPGKRGVGLIESTLQPGVLSLQVRFDGGYDTSTYNAKPTTAKAEVAKFLEVLQGSPLLKGEESRTQVRVQRAKQLFEVLNSVWRSLY
jgi:hypothetical protein